MEYRDFYSRPSVMQYQQLQDEFKQRKQAGALNNQLTQAKIQDFQKNGGLGQSPASVREWEYYNNLPEQDRERYLQMKRSDQVLNLGGTMAVRNPTGGIAEEYNVTPKMTETPQYMAAQSGAQETAKINAQLGGLPQLDAERERQKILAQDQAEAVTGYGQSSENSRQMLDLLNDIENDPGLSAVVGMPIPWKGGFGIGNIPGTPAADFKAKIDRLGGKQFLEAFESLKGGGQITQIEGEKATNAIASMQTSQSEEAFRRSLQEFKEIVIRASERAAQKAGQDPMQASQQAIGQRQQEIGANPFQSNGLSAEEQSELEALRAKYGR